MTMQTHVLSWLLGTSLLQLSSAWDSDIRIPPSITTGPPKYRLFKEKEDIQIPCEATGTATIEYYWYKNDVLIDLNDEHIHWDPTQPGGAIIIEDTKEEDEGYYQCQVESVNGKSLSDMLFLQVAVLDTTSGDVTRIYHVDVGKSLRINIEDRTSVPDPTFKWVTVREDDSGSTDVIRNKRVNTDASGNLYFSYVTPTDGTLVDYIYRCNIKNPYLDVTVGTSYSTLTVDATGDDPDVAPEIMYRAGDGSPVVGLLGQELMIGCFFSGKGDVDIQWKRSSSNDLAPHHKPNNHNTELWIDPVILTDEDTFTCTGTNSQGSADGIITVKVEAIPEFDDAEHPGPKPQNVSDGDTVVFYCKAMAIPPATVTWYLNGQPFADPSPDNRFRISDDGTMLNISDVCKKCDDPIHNSDLMNIQCNASNVHGYAYSEGYLNVLERTEFTISPPLSTDIVVGEGEEIVLPCEATTDDSTSLSIDWLYNDAPFENEAGVRVVDDVTNYLYVWTETQEVAEKVMGRYTCVASNGVSVAMANADLVIPGLGAVTTSSFDMWWIFIVIAAILFIIILLLCIVLYFQRNAGGDYLVDEKERAQGNDPDKELEDGGFHDYVRPPEPVPKPLGLGSGTPISIRHAPGTPASLGLRNPAYIASMADLDIDSVDGESMAEYGDIDPMKFNEDGSFIGQYYTISSSRQQIDMEEPQLPFESNI